MTAPTPALLNGTTAVCDILIANTSYSCVMGAWRASMSKQYLSQITFCSSGYRVEIGGIKACDVICSGFLSQGNAISDPLLYFGVVATGTAVVWQADTNCTLTGNFFIDPSFGVVAAANSDWTLACRSTGSFATTWKTS